MHNRFRDILLMRKTGKVISDSSMFDKRLGLYLNDRDYGGIITTATGNPVSIITNKAQNAISTILSYSPKQSGSGDPSPQNIRPIVGWAEANLGVNSETPTTTISLGGTYYGFSIDVERGVLRATHKAEDLGSKEWTVRLTNHVFYTSFPDRKIQGSGTTNAICEMYATGPVSALSAGGIHDKSVTGRRDSNNLMFRDNDIDTIADFLTAVTGIKVVYELATPLELPLTPQTVALLAGNNTIWTDGDEVTLTYKAKRG